MLYGGEKGVETGAGKERFTFKGAPERASARSGEDA